MTGINLLFPTKLIDSVSCINRVCYIKFIIYFNNVLIFVRKTLLKKNYLKILSVFHQQSLEKLP